MLLPNKLFSYEESILSRFPLVLSMLQEKPMRVSELYKRLNDYVESVNDFIEILDCLYALGKIESDGEEGVLKYVI